MLFDLTFRGDILIIESFLWAGLRFHSLDGHDMPFRLTAKEKADSPACSMVLGLYASGAQIALDRLAAAALRWAFAVVL